MKDNLSKITKILLIVLFVVTVIFIVKFYMGMSSIEDMKAEEINKIETTDVSILDGTDSELEAKKAAINWLGYFFKFTYFVGFLAVAAVIGFSVLNFVLKLKDEPKKALLGIIPLLVLVLVLLIAYYGLASDKLLDMPNYKGDGNVPGTLLWTGTGIMVMYALFGFAILSIIYVEIAKAFK